MPPKRKHTSPDVPPPHGAPNPGAGLPALHYPGPPTFSRPPAAAAAPPKPTPAPAKSISDPFAATPRAAPATANRATAATKRSAPRSPSLASSPTKRSRVFDALGGPPTARATAYGARSSSPATAAYPSSPTRAPGPSQQTPVAAAPAKKTRKIKDPDAPEQEKRGAVFKKKCPKNILERVDRVIEQRFFMVDRRRNGNELREEFSVLGSTGNVYTVIIDKTPSCDCPDHRKGNHCKHILFIYLKVLQVPQSSPHWYQKALLTSELEEIFARAPPAPAAVANARVRDAYARATGRSTAAEPASPGKRRVPTADDDCPICYEGMAGAAEAALVWCDGCGGAVHKECFAQWENTSKRQGKGVACVYCRAPWPRAGPPAAGPSRAGATSEGYLNLADVAGLDRTRDTSSYYHGPRWGKRHYGYQDCPEFT